MALSTDALDTGPIPSAAAALAVAGAAGAASAAPAGSPAGAAAWTGPSWREPSGAVGNPSSESRPVARRKARIALSTGAVGTALALRGADGAAPAGTASEADSVDEVPLEAEAAEVGVVVVADAIDTPAAPGVVAGTTDAVDEAAADPATYSAEPTVC